MDHKNEIRALEIRTAINDLINDIDILYINVFYTGLEMVEKRYLIDETPTANLQTEVIETSYTSRLISKINILFENAQNNPYGLDCAGPEKKGLYSSGDDKNAIIKHPDIVIHKGSNPQTGQQEIICEIKRITNLGASEMIYDLNKLINYTDSENWGKPYRIAIFLVYNCNIKQLKEKVERYRNVTCKIEKLNFNSEFVQQMSFSEFVTVHQERLRNILCFCHVDEKVVEVCTMFDIMGSQLIN